MKFVKKLFQILFKCSNTQTYLNNSSDHADVKKRMEDVMKKMNYYC